MHTHAGELELYQANCTILAQQAGAKMPAPQPVTFNGITTHMHPAVVLQPSWAPLVGDVKVGASTCFYCMCQERHKRRWIGVKSCK